MKLILHVIILSISSFYLLHALNDRNKLKDEALNPQWSYCFEFTWFGPDYDNSSTIWSNKTCDDYLEESGAKYANVPCNPPIVITNNGTFPDMDYLWTYHKASIVCRRSNGQVCARYAYYFNGQMKNSTYMCTKVHVVGEDPVKKGCFKQKVNEYDVEVCLCESGRGIYKPCNIF